MTSQSHSYSSVATYLPAAPPQVKCEPTLDIQGDVQNLGSVQLSSNGPTPHNASQVHVTKQSLPFNGLSFHNPFDVNSYPMTNPPLYDPSMVLPYGAPGSTHYRRISISNGQIGQIVNHEAYFIDEDSVDEFTDSSELVYRRQHHHANYQDDVNNSRSSLSARTAADMTVPPTQVKDSDESSSHPLHNFDSGRPPETTMPPTVTTAPTVSATSNSASDSSPVAGVPPPNHSLIYNNEVIYNPHDGPIPGTAAWKKERLLERNRVAASKCRQRKKHAQQQLQNNIAKYERDLQEKDKRLAKYEEVLAIYNSALRLHFDGVPGSLDSLLPMINQPIGSEKTV